MKSFDEYNAREQQLVQFNKWANHEGLSLRMSGEFDHSNKDTHMAYLGYVEGQQSKQAEVDELRKRVDEALVKISNHYHSCVARKKLKRMSASISEISEIEVHELNMRALKNILKGDQS